MEICNKHKFENWDDIKALVTEMRLNKHCLCCGKTFRDLTNSYYSTDKPPPSWPTHETCCKFSQDIDYKSYLFK